VRFGQFLRQLVVVGKVNHTHFWPMLADRVGQERFGAPFAEGMLHANDQLRFRRAQPFVFFRRHCGRDYGRILKSVPDISAGRRWPRTPSSVGAISRRAPSDLSRSFSLSVTRMNGTGFVV